jgi:NMD protein affecting ribosome stability and mRNA decay
MKQRAGRRTGVDVRRKKSKGLIRALHREFARDDKSPAVVYKGGKYREPTVCARCGAVFLDKTWRRDHKLTPTQIERGEWAFCPACDQVARHEGQGRLMISGSGAVGRREAIVRRIRNVERRAMWTHPERRVASISAIDRNGRGLEVITTSQKLAHRIAHELRKLFGGKTSYKWSDDGTLHATWRLD